MAVHPSCLKEAPATYTNPAQAFKGKRNQSVRSLFLPKEIPKQRNNFPSCSALSARGGNTDRKDRNQDIRSPLVSAIDDERARFPHDLLPVRLQQPRLRQRPRRTHRQPLPDAPACRPPVEHREIILVLAFRAYSDNVHVGSARPIVGGVRWWRWFSPG